jgi:hypothetical protein
MLAVAGQLMSLSYVPVSLSFFVSKLDAVTKKPAFAD